jgi:galactose oxidase
MNGLIGSWRGDHSTALLLPDATVLTAGGGERDFDFQIYEPPYLHCGDPRPVITGGPTAWSYGGNYSLTYTIASGGSVDRVVLMRPGSVTHAFDSDQRSLILPMVFPQAGTLTVTAPPNGTYAPPGYYMVFLISDLGVPSEAAWIKLG